MISTSKYHFCMQLKPYHTAFQRSFCLPVITEVECLKTRVSKQNDQVGDDVDVTASRLQSLHTLHTTRAGGTCTMGSSPMSAPIATSIVCLHGELRPVRPWAGSLFSRVPNNWSWPFIANSNGDLSCTLKTTL